MHPKGPKIIQFMGFERSRERPPEATIHLIGALVELVTLNKANKNLTPRFEISDTSLAWIGQHNLRVD